MATETPSDADEQQLTEAGLNRLAIKEVPVVGFALGLAAIAILASIARAAISDVSWMAMVPVIAGTILLMVLLITVASIPRDDGRLTSPALFLVWSVSIIAVVSLATVLAAIAFRYPPDM